MKGKQNALFEDRFLESFTGFALMKDQKVAIMELIANSWDAGASLVQISWPVVDGDLFSITDNGHGMTDVQFERRFRTLAYNRSKYQGVYAEVPADNINIGTKRPVFGRNGKGRFAGFSFGDSFNVKTWRDSQQNTFKVFVDRENSLSFQKLNDTEIRSGHGTEIFVDKALKPKLSDQEIRAEIGMRFLTDPNFIVTVNQEKIAFQDIPKENVEIIDVDIENIGKVKITVIDTQNSDKTTQQHGIAWHVQRRLVGECTWKGSGHEYFLDGRRSAAKRYTFIVEADLLKESDAVLPDWTGFYPQNETYKIVFDDVQKAIKGHLLELTKSTREATLNDAKTANRVVLKQLGFEGRDRWEKFVVTVQEECPSITDDDLIKLSSVLATLENTESKFQLVHQLSEFNPQNLDDLNGILDKWNIDLAKIVLDELEFRLQLLEKLRLKVNNDKTEEVQDLQPLFHRGLWIFGPEYETIEYTSNEGMTSVIQKLFGDQISASRIRPDFAIIPDGTVGFYGYPKYDLDTGGEIGIDRLTIVELKKPGIPIAKKEKDQPIQYIRELSNKGLIKKFTKITCFVLGSEVDEFSSGVSTEQDGKIRTIPLDYDTIILRAKSRLFNLYSKVSNAPFLEDTRLKEYIKEKAQLELWVK